jgi:hypothetical protein
MYRIKNNKNMKYLKNFEDNNLSNISISGNFYSPNKLSSLNGVETCIDFITKCISTFGINGILKLEKYNIVDPILTIPDNKDILIQISIRTPARLNLWNKGKYGENYMNVDLWESDFAKKLYNELKKIYGSYEYQKEFLTEFPEKYKDLEFVGYNDKIKEEFDWLFNAVDMGLM